MSSGFSDEKLLSSDSTVIEIPSNSEWRLEVNFDKKLTLKVIEGNGEIFGNELPNDVELQFSGCKISIFSFKGCKIQYKGEFFSEYISEETSMSSYINLHFGLEKYRQKAKEYNLSQPAGSKTVKGPRVLIVGTHDSGKSSLIKILCSYANKMDSQPLLVNLNPEEAVFGLPGSLTATPISDMLNVEATWGGTATSGPTYHHPKQPLVKNFGLENFKDNLKLYKYQVSRLGIACISRMEEDIDIKNSGFLIDTPSLGIKDLDLIDDFISDFEINFIVVLGNERLFIDIKKKFKDKINNQQLNVFKLPKSGGVVEKDDSYKRSTQQKGIREYFYGEVKTDLSPYSVSVDFKDVCIYKPVETGDSSNMSFLPIGEQTGLENENSEFNQMLVKIEPSASLLTNSIVSITHCPKDDFIEDYLLNSSVMGYGYISDVDDTKQKIKILLPVAGRLPNNVMILSKFRYHE